MSENSKIEWTDHTFNPWRGCVEVSPGCKYCYAKRGALRNPATLGKWGSCGTRVFAVPSYWKQLAKWNKNAAQKSSSVHYPRVFCASWADVFEDWKGLMHFPDKTIEAKVAAAWYREGVGIVRAGQTTATGAGCRLATMQDARDQLFQAIETNRNLDFLLLTKRPENVMRMVPPAWRVAFPGNVWMGTTVEDQARADERIPELLKIPARVRFLSCEPLLEHIKPLLRCRYDHNGDGDCHIHKECPRIHWVICGGESGSKARAMHPRWAASLRLQCEMAKVPFFFKQWGSKVPMSTTDGRQILPFGEYDVETGFGFISKNSSSVGRRLDGREWSEFPVQSNTARIQ